MNSELQFLESVENLKRAVKINLKWTPTTEQANGIAACLRQGRLFYEAAADSPLEIRPLQLYYGMIAFAKAITLANDRKSSLSALPQTHGVKDISAANSKLQDLRVLIQGRGTFQVFNDCVAQLNQLVYFSPDTTKLKFSLPTASATEIEGFSLSLKDILSRVPSLAGLYNATFAEQPNVDDVEVHSPNNADSKIWSVRIFDRQRCRNLVDLRSLVARSRLRMPFLSQWNFSDARFSWGKTALTFNNSQPLKNELDEGTIKVTEESLISIQVPSRDMYFSDIAAHLDPLSGGNSSNTGITHAIHMINGKFLSEYTMHYMALHLLSSLVRYRPGIWMHALSRGSSAVRPADDTMLALLEKFMMTNQVEIPSLVCKLLTPGGNN